MIYNSGGTDFPGLGRYRALGARLSAVRSQAPEMSMRSNAFNPMLPPPDSDVPQPHGVADVQAPQPPQAQALPAPPAISQIMDVQKPQGLLSFYRNMAQRRATL